MAKDIFSLSNLEIRRGKNDVIISVNPKIYPMSVIFSAAYIFIDKAYVIVDGDPSEEILVQLKAKGKKTSLEELGRQFNNELINYSFYAAQTARSMPIRTAMVQRAFFTQAQQTPNATKAAKKIVKPRKPRRRKIGKGKGKAGKGRGKR